jgi:hypothetical protein
MWKTTTNIYLKRNLYKTIQKGDIINSENKNLIMYHLFFQSLEELHGTTTELLIIMYYITYKREISLAAKAARQGATTKKELKSDVFFSSSDVQNSAQPLTDNDNNTNEFTDMLSRLGFLCEVYTKYRDYMLKLWEKINNLDYNYDFDENDLLVSGIISNKELAYKFNNVSNLNLYLDLLLDLYSNLYKRRQNLILNNDYTNYVSLIINQKLPSPKGYTYDISYLFKNKDIFEDSSNLTSNKTYKSKLGLGLVPSFERQMFNNKKKSNSRKYSTISYSKKLSNITKKIPYSRNFSILKFNKDIIP